MQVATSHIGRCVGCNNMRRLQTDACEECLGAPNRGPKWLELARRVRNDPEFALACFNRLPKEPPAHRIAFVEKYGLPAGAEDPRPTAEILPFRPRR